MVSFVLFVNMFNVLIVSTLWTPGVLAPDLNTHQGYHNVSCDWHCVIQDASTVVKAFKKEVSLEETSAVNLTISNQMHSMNDICQNSSLENVSSYLVWAASEKEPYLFLPSDFRLFSDWISLRFRSKIKITMNCTREARRAPIYKRKGTSLSDAVMTSVRQKLMRTTGGTLCYLLTPRQENTDGSYKCCKFDDTTCNVIHSPEYVLWFSYLQIAGSYILPPVIVFYLLAICTFPDGMKVSKDKIACVELGDQSPAGTRMLMAKAGFFIPHKMESCKDRAMYLILRVTFPIITGIPLLLAHQLNVLSSPLPLLFALCMFYPFYVIKSIISACSEDNPNQDSGVRCMIKTLMIRRNRVLKLCCTGFTTVTSFTYFNLDFKTLCSTFWSSCKISLCAVVILFFATPLCLSVLFVAIIIFSLILSPGTAFFVSECGDVKTFHSSRKNLRDQYFFSAIFFFCLWFL